MLHAGAEHPREGTLTAELEPGGPSVRAFLKSGPARGRDSQDLGQACLLTAALTTRAVVGLCALDILPREQP